MTRLTIAALAWTLIHFLWQGALIGLAAGLACAVLDRARPATRYAVLCAALAAMVLAPAVTVFILSLPSSVVPSPVAAAPAAAASPWTSLIAASPAGPSSEGGRGLAWVVGIWLSGVALLGARSIGGWMWAQRLKRRGTSPAAPGVRRVADSLRERLGIRRAVRILNTAVAEVPTTMGWLKPVVLLPVSALTSLSPEQIELLIAHELAHVRRHDYLVNLIQTAVETVLFYHPAVWWISGKIRVERESCCDDLAVAACGNVEMYVEALAALEGLRARRPGMVLAADGGALLHRIRRLVNREREPREAPPAWLGALVPPAIVLAAVLSAAPPRTAAAPPRAADAPSSRPSGHAVGYLSELAESGYRKLTVDEIITLKDHGVEPRFVKDLLSAGLGVPDVDQVINLRDHGVQAGFVAGMVTSGLVSDLDFANVIHLRENDARGDDMGRIRALGFGPFAADEVIRLRQNGVDATTFEALKEAGADRAVAADAVAFRQNGVTTERIRDMKRQGFHDLSLRQILDLARAGVI